MNFKLSRKAKADLKSIALYTEREWGRDQRNHYIFQFDQCFHLLGKNPNLGQFCEEIRVISARDMHRKERAVYEQAKKDA